MDKEKIESHPLKPFLPEKATVMMLGSFPPKKQRWSMDFYYPNLQNDMWRIFGVIFFDNKDYFLDINTKLFCRDRIAEFLSEKGIAVGDTAISVVRLKDNASDKFLDIVEPMNFDFILKQLPMCKTFVVTGQKALDTFVSITGANEPCVGGFSDFNYGGRLLRLYRMPSSSRAYPKPLFEKAVVYEKMFFEIGLCN